MNRVAEKNHLSLELSKERGSVKNPKGLPVNLGLSVLVLWPEAARVRVWVGERALCSVAVATLLLDMLHRTTWRCCGEANFKGKYCQAK